MNIRTLALALIVMTATSCKQAPGADTSKPEAYAVLLPLGAAKGGSLQRLTLPAEALVALKRADLGDVRVFDASGRMVPLALVEGGATDDARHRVSVPVYPVVGPVNALGKSGLSIRIEDGSVARVVTVGSSPPLDRRAASPPAVLLDTHALREPANAIALDAEIPASQPVTMTLLTSANLKEWEPLAEKTLFRPTDGSKLLGGAEVVLPGVDLHGRYVGITWSDAAGVKLRGASIITSTIARPARSAIATSAVPLANAYELRFDLPDMARLAAIRLTESGPDGVIPVKLYGRDQTDDPWTLLSATTLRPGSGGNVLDHSGPPMASYRLQADRRTAGFSTAPKLELLLDPVELLVALSGTPPYRLAVGQAAAPASYLTLAEIGPQASPIELANLPQAKLAGPLEPPLVIALEAGAADGALEPRKLVLWAALLLGTLVLAFAAIRLLRAAAAGTTAKDK
jgi:hypothetical protein